MKKTILITGINGFLGSCIAKKLAINYNIIGLESRLDNLFRLTNYSFKVYSSKHNGLEKIFNENIINIIIHTATFYGKNTSDIPITAQTNLFMPIHLLESAIKNKVSSFINTDTVLDRFTDPYALTKKQFQEWLFLRKNEIQVINMQLEHFYGPGCNSSNFIMEMISRLNKNEDSISLTKGEQRRDFIYYEDVVNAFDLVMHKLDEIDLGYNNFEIGTGINHSIKEVMLMLKELTGSTSKLKFGKFSYRKNELMESTANITKITKLGWVPKTALLNGLLSTFNQQ